jgi:hypothetical protein
MGTMKERQYNQKSDRNRKKLSTVGNHQKRNPSISRWEGKQKSPLQGKLGVLRLGDKLVRHFC